MGTLFLAVIAAFFTLVIMAQMACTIALGLWVERLWKERK